jgi:hypothetical protein
MYRLFFTVTNLTGIRFRSHCKLQRVHTGFTWHVASCGAQLISQRSCYTRAQDNHEVRYGCARAAAVICSESIGVGLVPIFFQMGHWHQHSTFDNLFSAMAEGI